MIRKFHLFCCCCCCCCCCFSPPFIILLNVCRTVWGYSFVPKREYRICHVGSAITINVVFSLPPAPDDSWITGGEWIPPPPHTHTHKGESQMCRAIYGVRVLAAQDGTIWIQRCLNRAEAASFEDQFKQFLPLEIVSNVFLITFNYKNYYLSHNNKLK